MSPRSDDYKRGYAKGYQTGAKGCWPPHRPPTPPDEIAGPIIDAARALRDAIDSEVGLMIRDDPEWDDINEAIDAFDETMARLSEYAAAVSPVQESPE